MTTTTDTFCLFCPVELDETTKPEHILRSEKND
jgi:hypothetical protein